MSLPGNITVYSIPVQKRFTQPDNKIWSPGHSVVLKYSYVKHFLTQFLEYSKWVPGKTEPEVIK